MITYQKLKGAYMDKINLYIKQIEELENELRTTVSNINYKSLKHSDKEIVKIIALGFMSRIIENTESIIILLKSRVGYSSLLPILRNSLEAIIDLDNLANIDGYLEYLVCIDLENKLSLPNKNYFKKLTRKKDIDYRTLELEYKNSLDSLKKKISENYSNKFFKDDGNLKNSVFFRFKLSKSLDTYETMYYLLCNDTHNNLSSIEKNYINSDMSVSIFKEISLDDLETVCQTSISMLKDLEKKIYSIFDIDSQ